MCVFFHILELQCELLHNVNLLRAVCWCFWHSLILSVGVLCALAVGFSFVIVFPLNFGSGS